jgi:hypothetical protein
MLSVAEVYVAKNDTDLLRLWLNLRYYSGIGVEGVKKTSDPNHRRYFV